MLFQQRHQIIKAFDEQNFKQFVSLCIETQRTIDNYKKGDAKDQNEAIVKNIDETQNIVDCYLSYAKQQYQLLPRFAFWLRQLDDVQDTYSKKFLDDLKPEFLKQVILNNTWISDKRQMHTTFGPFELTVGRHRNVFHYRVNEQKIPSYYWPFLKKKKNKSKNYENSVYIYLTEDGFQLGLGIMRLLPEYEIIHNRSYQWMVWANSNYQQTSVDCVYSKFIIEPFDHNDPESGYRLYVNTGKDSPVLIANKTNPIWSTKLLCSTVRRHGIFNPEKSTWFFD